MITINHKKGGRYRVDTNAPREHDRDVVTRISIRNQNIIEMTKREPAWKVAQSFGISRSRVYAIKKRLGIYMEGR